MHKKSKRQKTDKSSFLRWTQHLHQNVFINKLLYLEEKYLLRRHFFIFISILFLCFLNTVDFKISQEFQKGDTAYENIFSPFSFEMVDQNATLHRKEEAQKRVSPIFDYDDHAAHKLSLKIQRAFSVGKSLLDRTSNDTVSQQQSYLIPSLQKNLKATLNVELSDSLCKWLIKNKFHTKIQNTLIYILNQWLNTHTLSLALPFISEEHQTFILRPLNNTEKAPLKTKRSKILYLGEDEDRKSLKLPKGLIFKKKDKVRLKELSQKLLVHNISLNNKAWIEQKKNVAKTVLPVILSVHKNQLIVRRGSPVQTQHLQLLEEIKKRKRIQQSWRSLFFKALLFSILFILLLKYIHRSSKLTVPISKKDIVFFLCTLCIHLFMAKLFLYFGVQIFSSPTSPISSISPTLETLSFLKKLLIFTVPVALGPMLISLLTRSLHLGWIFTLFSALFLSSMTEMKGEFLIFSLCSGLVAIYGVHECKKRNDIYRAGLFTGFVSGWVIFCILITTTATATSSLIGSSPFISITSSLYLYFLLFAFTFSFVSGMFSSLLTMSLVPILESLFQYITDIKLLELSNLNHPLLKQMLMKAPGTYHHSIMAGNMVEAAAENIHANPLLGKVMSYYHDIGKLEYPNYFIENQKQGDNPHRHISPYMSKTILIAHVKDGVELARKHKLGQPIVDGILQHHGTSLISFFYQKALETKDEHINEVDREAFCYPGPKPQSKESALCMLADTIEATARSMEKPNVLKLKQLVKKTIQNKFMEKQLDECHLTLKDLEQVERAFLRILPSIYHQRLITTPSSSLPPMEDLKTKKPREFKTH